MKHIDNNILFRDRSGMDRKGIRRVQIAMMIALN